MEALLEREGKVENWNDDRLDELSQTMKEGFAKVDRRFERVEERFELVEGEMKEGFARVGDRLDKLFYLLIVFLISLSAAVISHAVSV
jgi:tetrahydromethanopterin S-methyltransferase subunit G